MVKPNQTDPQADTGKGPSPVPDITSSLMSNQHQLSHLLCRLQNQCSPICAPYNDAGHHLVQVEMDIQGEVTPSSAQCLSGAGQGGTAHGQTLHHHLPGISCSLRLHARPPKAAAEVHTEGRSLCSPRHERCQTRAEQIVQDNPSASYLLLISTFRSGETPCVPRLCNQAPTSSHSDSSTGTRTFDCLCLGLELLPSARLNSQHLLLMSPFCSNIFPCLIQPISNNK